MRTIAKYELKEGENKIVTPNLSEPVCATDQDGKVWLWMEVDTEETEFVDRAFLVTRTGDDIDGGMVLNYIGYVHLLNGEVVVVWEVL
jgi:hypothetical protein